jgi:predicted dehydrogenase
MSKTRIAFVGVGGMGQAAHLRNYASIGECEVVAIAEKRAALGAKVAARYGIPRVYESHERMLDEVECDGIVASQPFSRHYDLVPDLLTRGKPVFTEKPLAVSVEAGRKIVAAVETSGAFHMVGYHKRSDPATVWAKAEIERLKATRELGSLRYVRIVMPPGDWIAAGFVDNLGSSEPYPELPGEPRAADMDEATHEAYVSFVNYYIHQVNLMRHLLGEAYAVTHADPSGVLMVVRSASGVAGVLEMAPYQTTVDWQESATVCFERGWIRIELPAPLASNRPGRVVAFRDPGNGATPQTVEPQMPWVHAMRNQALNFIKAIRGEAKPPCGAAEALMDLEVAREYIRMVRGERRGS